MADKSITDLNVVPGSIDDSNTWFAVAQSNAAYKVSGHDFILALTVILDGHGGIKSITGPTTVGLVDTYTITFADDTTTTFAVENGKGITGISKTGTSGLVDTYTITYNDGSTSTFTVTNGAKGDTGDSWYVWIRYSGSQPTQDSDMGTEPDNWMGIYSGTSSTAPVHYTDYDWFQIKGEKGDQGDPASIVSQSVTYQEGTSPNVQPSGTWTTTIPVVSQGNYLWTRTIVTFNSGSPVTFFSVARMGLDGSGSVSSVNNQSPDANGNVALTADDIPTAGGTSVEADLSGVKNTLSNLKDETIGSLSLTGTNNTGSTILSGTVFFNNGDFVRATKDIANNDSITNSNTEAVSNGGINAIVNSFLTPIDYYSQITAGANTQKVSGYCYRIGFIVYYQLEFKATANHTGNAIIATGLPHAKSATITNYVVGGSSDTYQMLIKENGDFCYLYSALHITANNNFTFQGAYLCKD